MKKNIHNRKSLKSKRRDLRKRLTPAEAFLWKQLPNRKFEGRKFRRQHSIKNYIVDFYCPEEKDSKRDLELQQLGFTVLRFENKMVFDFLHRF